MKVVRCMKPPPLSGRPLNRPSLTPQGRSLTSPNPDRWDCLGTPRVCVIGDLILDYYQWTTAERVSPEAPVLILQAEGEEDRLGGASVATLLRGLKAFAVAVFASTNSPSTYARILENSLGRNVSSRAVRLCSG